MSIIRFFVIIPTIIVLFLFGMMTFSYIKYKKVKDPNNIPTRNIPEFNYWSEKLNYIEDGLISAGFIIIFILIVIAIPLYINMFKINI